MSSFRKKARPLLREEKTYADDTLFIVACEDRYAPEQYFKMLPNERIKVKVLPTLDTRSNPQAVLARLNEFIENYDIHEYDQLWLALDTDHWASGNHKKSLAEVLKECQVRKIGVAISNPCFDLWLLLHQADVAIDDPPADCKDVGNRFRDLKGSFSKCLLNPDHYPVEAIVAAVARAKGLDVEPDNWFPLSPCTRVYKIVEQAIEKDFIRLGLIEV